MKNKLLFTTLSMACLLSACHVSHSTATTENWDAKAILWRTIAASGGDAWQQPQTLTLKCNAIFTPFGKIDTANRRIDAAVFD